MKGSTVQAKKLAEAIKGKLGEEDDTKIDLTKLAKNLADRKIKLDSQPDA